MNESVLETTDLTKVYRTGTAVEAVNVRLEAGKIYGFVGKNGAGKTTFLRMIAGLVFPSRGTLSLWGATGQALAAQRRRLGFMIETPAVFPSLSAAQNLEVLRLQRGLPDKGRVSEVLALVGLQDAGRKRARQFSLGMRQRLGLAMALLHMPEFLILDEPVNGLDPAGIADLRRLLLRLNRDYGMTMLISSHILEELHQLATDYIFIDRGRVIETLSAQTLDARCKRHLAIRTTDPSRAMLALEQALDAPTMTLLPDGMIRLYACLDTPETVAQILADAQVLVTGLAVAGDSLETYFLQTIGGEKHVDASAR